MSVNFIREDAKKGLEVKLKFTVSADELNQKREKKISQWSKEARIDGFRPGKVPVSVIRKRFESAAHEELLQKTIQDSFEMALKKENIEPITQPKVDIISRNIGEDAVFECEFERYPVFSLVDFSKMKLKKPESSLSEKSIDEGIAAVVKQNRVYTEVDQESSEGDQLIVDFAGVLNGGPFPGGSAKGHKFILGQGAMLPDFESHLFGKRAGDSLEFPLSFPADYHAKELAGKTVNFLVDIRSVSQGKDPEVNDDLFKKLNCNPCNKEGFLKAVKQPLQLELDHKLRTLKKKNVFDELVKQHKLILPDSHVEDELKRLEMMHKQQNNADISTKDQKNLIKQAEKNIKLSFILREIIEKNNIQVDESLVNAEIAALSGSYDDQSMFAKWYREDKQRMEMLRSQVLEEQACDWVLEQAQVTVDSVDFDKLSELIEKE